MIKPKTQKIKPPKFLHVAYHIHQQLFQDGLMISGFYNWHRAFGGEFSYFPQCQDKLEEYDIIFVGISKPELDGCLLSLIREKLSKDTNTIIVACVDYAVEMWQNTFNPIHMKIELEKSDFIFAAETSMISHIKALLPHRDIYHLVHPTDTLALKSRFVKDYDLRRNALISVIHRYDNNWLDMHLATSGINDIDTYALMLDPSIEVELLKFFKFTKRPVSYGNFMEFLSEAKICIESYHRMHSYGRVAVECACVKVPIVSTDMVTSAKMLWPETTIPAGDVYAQKRMIRKLIDDKDFYKEVTEKAFNNVEVVGYQNSVNMFMQMIMGKLPHYHKERKNAQ